MKLTFLIVCILVFVGIGSSVETRVKRNHILMNAFNKYRRSNQQPQRGFVSTPDQYSGGFRNPAAPSFRGRRSLLPLIRRPAS